jgi:hypothetical protein
MGPLVFTTINEVISVVNNNPNIVKLIFNMFYLKHRFLNVLAVLLVLMRINVAPGTGNIFWPNFYL